MECNGHKLNVYICYFKSKSQQTYGSISEIASLKTRKQWLWEVVFVVLSHTAAFGENSISTQGDYNFLLLMLLYELTDVGLLLIHACKSRHEIYQSSPSLLYRSRKLYQTVELERINYSGCCSSLQWSLCQH